MEYKCNICDRSFSSEESLNQHNSSKHTPKIEEEGKKGNITFRRYFIFIIIALIVIFSSLTVYSYSKKPGQQDDFVSCLNEKNVVVYGNDFCSYTLHQLGAFGKSKDNLNYIKCSENEELCDKKNIRITPTWEINGRFYEEVQGLDKIAGLSGCNLN